VTIYICRLNGYLKTEDGTAKMISATRRVGPALRTLGERLRLKNSREAGRKRQRLFRPLLRAKWTCTFPYDSVRTRTIWCVSAQIGANAHDSVRFGAFRHSGACRRRREGNGISCRPGRLGKATIRESRGLCEVLLAALTRASLDCSVALGVAKFAPYLLGRACGGLSVRLDVMDDAQLQTIWQQRQPRSRLAHLSGPLALLMKHDLGKKVKQLSSLARIWDEVIPPEIAQHTALESLRRGVLTVAVDTAAHRFQLRTLLDGGLQQAIGRRHVGAINKIRLVPGTFCSTDEAGHLRYEF